MCHFPHDYSPDSTNMCAQTIFTVLDHLASWVNGKRKATAARRVKGQPQKSMFSQWTFIEFFVINGQGQHDVA